MWLGKERDPLEVFGRSNTQTIPGRVLEELRDKRRQRHRGCSRRDCPHRRRRGWLRRGLVSIRTWAWG